MTTEASKDETSELVKELKLIRSILFCILVFMALALTYTVVTTSMPRPAPNWQELGNISSDLKNIRDELRLLRPNHLPSIVIPVNPTDGKKDTKPAEVK
jgi:regulatory protein YycH of two-component signal transduction system YycFG